MKVYVLTCGEYSDYRIIATTVDKAVAEKLAETFGLEIEDFDALTDASVADLKGLNHYTLHMYKNGKVEYNVMKNVPPDEFSIHPVYRIRDMNLAGADSRPRMIISLWARSPNHAIKAANEIRVQLIASERFKNGVSGVWGISSEEVP